MQGIIDFIQNMDWMAWIVAVNALLLGLISFFSLIPGDQPEAFLRKVVDWLAVFSRKPKK